MFCRKMSAYLFLTVISFLLFSCSSSKSPVKEHSSYFPEEFFDLYFGMRLDEFSADKDIETMTKSTTFSSRVEYTEKFPDKKIKQAVYYFTSEGNPFLYEMIVEFDPSVNLFNLTRSKFGPPNFGEEWRFPTNEGFKMMIWIYENKIIYACNLPGSPWENEE